MCVVRGVLCVVCGVWWGGGEGGGGGEKGGGEHRQWWVGAGPYVLWRAPSWLPEIHGDTYGPNSRKTLGGASVAWCPT